MCSSRHRFLYEESSRAHKFYKQRVTEIRDELNVASGTVRGVRRVMSNHACALTHSSDVHIAGIVYESKSVRNFQEESCLSDLAKLFCSKCAHKDLCDPIVSQLYVSLFLPCQCHKCQ